MIHARGIEGTRVLQGLLSLTKKHPCEALEKACEIALAHGCWRLRALRQLLGRKVTKQEPLPFLEEHPIIRPMADYGAVVARAIQRQKERQEDRSSWSEGFLRHGWTETNLSRAQKESPSPRAVNSSFADLSPPRSGYPLSGCTSAEPDSVSPAISTVVPPSPFRQEHSDE